MVTKALESAVREVIEETFKKQVETVPLEFPTDSSFGDLTVNAFLLAKELKLAPQAIAEALATGLAGRHPVRSAESVKGYVNVRLEDAPLFSAAVTDVLAEGDAYGRNTGHAKKRLMVEFSAPNTNKPLHLGHMRNNFLGESVSRILRNDGAEVIKANLLNDRGIHICKSMLAYERFGKGETPTSSGMKGDHLVGKYYVEFETRFREDRDRFIAENPDHFVAWSATKKTDRKGKPVDDETLRQSYVASFKDENFGVVPLGRDCQEMLRNWEAGDDHVRKLWSTMNAWAMQGFEASYARMGVSFDELYRESETYILGRDLVMDAVQKGIFETRADGAIFCDLTAEKLDKKVVLRSDGTSIYITQDIGTTIMKAEKHALDGQVWVVADEQAHHFKVLFKILEKLGYDWAGSLFHLAYGLVNLPDGRMKSREGTVVDADDLIDEVAALSDQEIRARDPEGLLSDEEAARRSEIIALAALRFMLLKVSPKSTMIFNPEDSVKFEGDTGSRILYALARLNSMILDGAADAMDDGVATRTLSADSERNLALRLLAFPGITARAARELSPAIIANYLLEVAKELNRFYEQVSVLKESDQETRRARLALCKATALVIRRATELLGMETLERM